MAAEEEDAAPAATVEESAPQDAATDTVEAEDEGAVAPAEFVPPVPLFQEVNVSTNSSISRLVGAVVAIFSKGERAVDLVLIDPRQKQKLLYVVASLPEKFAASGLVLTRRRDRRLRVRVIMDFAPRAEKEPETLLVGRMTNSSKLGTTIKERLVDTIGNNKLRSVMMRFNGRDAASAAILGIEIAGMKAHRELFFVPKFLVVSNNTAASAPEDGEAGKRAPIRRDVLVSVIAG